jgi:hypothetical protein
MPSRPPSPAASSLAPALRLETVAHQLDDVNVLGEALVAAFNEADDARIARTRAALDRYVVALGWNLKPTRGRGLLPPDAQLDAGFTLSLAGENQTASASLDAEFLASAEKWRILAAVLTGSEAMTYHHLSGRLTMRLDRQGTRHVDAGVSWSNASAGDYQRRLDGAGGTL